MKNQPCPGNHPANELAADGCNGGREPGQDDNPNEEAPPVPPNRRPVPPVEEPPGRPGHGPENPPIEDPRPDKPRRL
jgi:hypothetical protein